MVTPSIHYVSMHISEYSVYALSFTSLLSNTYTTFIYTMTKTYTMGGAAINTQAQVLSEKDGEIIKGLYAAGEVSGGVHGNNR